MASNVQNGGTKRKSKETQIYFTGSSDSPGRDCELFIRAIRRKAKKRGRSNDTQWMADYAAACLDEQALRWHAALPDEVQDKWKPLVREMLARWPSSPSSSNAADVHVIVSRSPSDMASFHGICHIAIKVDDSVDVQRPGIRFHLSATKAPHSTDYFATPKEKDVWIQVVVKGSGLLRHLQIVDALDAPQEFLGAIKRQRIQKDSGNFRDGFLGDVLSTGRLETPPPGASWKGKIGQRDVWKVQNNGLLACQWPLVEEAEDLRCFLRESDGRLRLCGKSTSLPNEWKPATLVLQPRTMQ